MHTLLVLARLNARAAGVRGGTGMPQQAQPQPAT